MSLANGELSAADIAAVTGNNGGLGACGGDGAWWLLVLFLFAFNGNWGNGFGGNGGYGADLQRGFDQSAVMSSLTGINSAITSGFAAAEVADNARQIADMQQMFNLQSQFANCCCENRLGIANLSADIAREACADRAAVNDGIRDILVNQNAGIQRILDTMCQDKIDAKNERIADLERQLTMANLAASQGLQTSQILADNAAQTAALEQYLAPVPRPAYIVQNPNGCNCNSVCGSF